MLNQVTLVGRIVEITKRNDGDTILTIKIPRFEKNEDGSYSNDLINTTIRGDVANNVNEYCAKEDIVGVKGRVYADNDEIKIIGEKVSFLSTKKD